MTTLARTVLWLLVPVTLVLEVVAYLHYRNATDGVFVNAAILLYAVIAALAVWFLDFLYRTIRYPPHRRPSSNRLDGRR